MVREPLQAVGFDLLTFHMEGKHSIACPCGYTQLFVMLLDLKVAPPWVEIFSLVPSAMGIIFYVR